MFEAPLRAAIIVPLSRTCARAFQPLEASSSLTRAIAASRLSPVVPSPLWWKALSDCSRTCSLNVRRSAMIFGVLRMMHRLVEMTRNARMIRNQLAL